MSMFVGQRINYIRHNKNEDNQDPWKQCPLTSPSLQCIWFICFSCSDSRTLTQPYLDPFNFSESFRWLWLLFIFYLENQIYNLLGNHLTQLRKISLGRFLSQILSLFCILFKLLCTCDFELRWYITLLVSPKATSSGWGGSWRG